jgi:hypothetical protein
MEKKTVIFPTYLDVHKLNETINSIPKDIEIVIYEKKKDIEKSEQVILYEKRDNIIHYHIPFIGEQHYAFFLHIVNNYEKLNGIYNLSKTTWIPMFSSVSSFLNELNESDNVLYSQNNAQIRKFVFIFPDLQHMGLKQAIVELLKMNNITIDIQHLHSYNNECIECNQNLKCYNCNNFSTPNYPELHNIIFTAAYVKERDNCLNKLKDIFPGYSPVTEFNPSTVDGSYLIHSKIILQHSAELYKNLLNDIAPVWGHDEMNNFFHFFFKETLRRYNENATSIYTREDLHP